MQHTCTLSIHDASVSKEDVLLDLSLYPPIAFSVGDVVHLVAINNQDHEKAKSSQPAGHESSLRITKDKHTPKQSAFSKAGEGSDKSNTRRFDQEPLDVSKGFLFVVKDVPSDLITRLHGAQVCVEKFEPLLCC